MLWTESSPGDRSFTVVDSRVRNVRTASLRSAETYSRIGRLLRARCCVIEAATMLFVNVLDSRLIAHVENDIIVNSIVVIIIFIITIIMSSRAV